MDAGEVIQSRYELAEPLGQGGMAEVWRAHDRHLGRPVAIKFLAPQLSTDPEFLVRFFAEAQAVARISHPGVVKVLDFGEHDDIPYLVMEVVGGGALTELTGDPIEPDRALAIIAGAAAGAGAAHELGIVHRDIKPGNILLDEDGEPKLADFGIAASGRSERLTATGAAIGSPHYISPEQASGGDATPATDVYSFGVVLYELLTGRRPFEGENITAVAIAHVEQEPQPPSTVIPELPPAIDALILKCLAKDPALRFVDGNELATELERFDPAATGPVAAVVTTSPGRWVNPRVLAGVAVAALVLAVPIVTTLASGDDAVATTDDDETTLDNVGGLRIRRSPSPTADAVGAGAATATPTPRPTTKAEKRAAAKEQEEPEESKPEPTPEPEETDIDPTPEPTSDGSSPAPEP